MMVVFSEAAALSEAVMVADPPFSLSVRLSGERVTWKCFGCKFHDTPQYYAGPAAIDRDVRH